VRVTVNLKTGERTKEYFQHPDDIPNPEKVIAEHIIKYMQAHPEIIPSA